MEQTYLTGVKIEKVRHLQNISIPLSDKSRKHLVFTGKNGSGKTSVLEALMEHFSYIGSTRYMVREDAEHGCENWLKQYEQYSDTDDSDKQAHEKQKAHANYLLYKEHLKNWEGAYPEYTSISLLREKFLKGQFILAYYPAERKFQVEKYQNIEKITLKERYAINEAPGVKLTKYLVDMKAVQAFSKDQEKIQKIDNWFEHFEAVLKKIYDETDLKLVFDEETFQFSICVPNRDPFDFNTMSSGYAAIFQIINDLIMRMEAQTKTRSSFDMEGVVLIDEIDTHLHLELQRTILPALTELFPNLQFIITTHSPFILNSLDNAVTYDLEKKMLVAEGFKDLPYEGIVEGYFEADRLSDELRRKFNRYKELVGKSVLSDDEYAEIEELEYYLDEIPDYLATELATEYSRLKLEFLARG